MSLTLRKIKNTNFESLYKRFLLDEGLTRSNYETMLELAIVFLNSAELAVQKLGYRIVVIYTNRTRDYAPLYEVALNKGLYPVAKLIDSHHLKEEERTFFTEFNASFIESYKENTIYFHRTNF